MNKYFDVRLEFNHSKLEEIITSIALGGKGYCCFVDLTSLVYSYNNSYFKNLLNNASVNSCDGSYIAMSASRIYREELTEYIGPDFFKKFIYKKGSHLILGSTTNVFRKIIDKISSKGVDVSEISYLGLPFKTVEEFDYKSISEVINARKPNYIWISLGAPKQEYFMAKLLPLIDSGILLGVGAALNYFTGEIKDIPKWSKKFHLIWLYRLLTEPKKQIKRLKNIIVIFPKMIKEEIRKNSYN